MTSRLLIAMMALVVGVGCAGRTADGGPEDGVATAATPAGGPPVEEGHEPLAPLWPDRGPQYREVTVPAGTELRVALASKLSSDGSKVEDRVRGVLREPVVVEGVAALPEGALLEGSVLQAERSGRVTGLAQIAFRFTELAAHGETHRLDATRLAYSAEPTKKDDATKIGIGAGAGAVAGAIAGGRKGAAIGTGVGAAAGTGVVLATRGDEVMLAPGTVVTTRLNAPLRIRLAID